MLKAELNTSLEFDIRNLFSCHSFIEQMTTETVFFHHLIFAEWDSHIEIIFIHLAVRVKNKSDSPTLVTFIINKCF